MEDTHKFPNGYEVTVVRKQDIINCLDENIVDKELVLAVITQCEFDATNFIQQGRWTGLPFMGNVRVPKRIQKLNSPEIKELIQEAKETLDTKKYMIFRQQLAVDLVKTEKKERLRNYILSQFVASNRKLYNKYLKEKGEHYAKFKCSTLTNLSDKLPNDIDLWQQD